MVSRGGESARDLIGKTGRDSDITNSGKKNRVQPEPSVVDEALNRIPLQDEEKVSYPLKGKAPLRGGLNQIDVGGVHAYSNEHNKVLEEKSPKG